MPVHQLELDLDVFAGPFDLLLSLVLREELDLLEVDLAEIVLTYIDRIEQREGLDLEATTEFLVLIAALLELKSRLMLPGEEIEDLDELVPAEAADELLARMLAYARYRGAAEHLRTEHEAGRGFLYRCAPPPASLRRASLEGAEAVFSPAKLGAAVGGLLRLPPPVDLGHMRGPLVTVGERLAVLRTLLRRGRFSFDDAVAGADRVTECVTLWALLELYKQAGGGVGAGGAVRGDHGRGDRRPGAGGRRVSPLARTVQALLFLSADPVSVADLADAAQVEPEDVTGALAELGTALDGHGLVLREVAGGWTLATHPDEEEAARRLLARPRTPALTPAQSETLAVVAYLQPVSRPEVARIRGVASDSAASALLDRGLIEEAGRSQFGAILYRTTPLFLKLFGLRNVDELPDVGQWDPSPEDETALRERLLAAGSARSGDAPQQAS